MGKNTRRTFLILVSAVLFSGLTTAFVINPNRAISGLARTSISFISCKDLNTFYVDEFDPIR